MCGWEPRGPADKPVTGAAVCAWRGVWVPRLSPAVGDADGDYEWTDALVHVPYQNTADKSITTRIGTWSFFA